MWRKVYALQIVWAQVAEPPRLTQFWLG